MNPIQFFRNNIYENLKMAMDTIRGNKLRSFLTVIGVVIGVITVMLISSIISGIDMAVSKQIESFGTRSIFVYKFNIGNFSPPSREERRRKPLTVQDADAIRNIPSVEYSIPLMDVSSNFFGEKTYVSKNGKSSASIDMNGTLPDYERAGRDILIEGRFFTQGETDAAENVCVVGSSVQDNFFPYGSAVGETIDIGGREFRIVGLMQKREQFGGGGDESNVLYMPLKTALKIKPQADDLFILAIARPNRIEEAKDAVTDLLRFRRKVAYGEPNNFGIQTAEGIISNFRSITAGVAIAMIVISSVGLMIGGIGVMNIMLVSVTERTREIGIRKAIGAKQRDILLQFLIEAATLTGFGGLLGLLIGWGLTFLVRLIFPSYVPLWAPIAGFGASVGIGIIFGLFPAWKAARLDPIESLRYE
ncbi:MAG: ABC transporter permease [Acidobacteriota bacterium]|nr:ABC transporter permease [Acidobacteriota bacterium]